MPELVEVEAYRRLAERVVGRRIVGVETPDAWYLKGGVSGPGLRRAILAKCLTAVRRTGKLLLLDVEDGDVVLGVRFGMTGRLIVDGTAGVDRLVFASSRSLERWDRFVLRFEDGGDLRIRDPRRLGGVELNPRESRLGPDALVVGLGELSRALEGSRAPLKARLLDQSRVAGVGNLVADEVLWRAGLDPARPAGSLSRAEVRRLHRHLRAALGDLQARGGSHTGDLMDERKPGGVCPRDGAALRRATVGGRTTWWCPVHQG